VAVSPEKLAEATAIRREVKLKEAQQIRDEFAPQMAPSHTVPDPNMPLLPSHEPEKDIGLGDLVGFLTQPGAKPESTLDQNLPDGNIRDFPSIPTSPIGPQEPPPPVGPKEAVERVFGGVLSGATLGAVGDDPRISDATSYKVGQFIGAVSPIGIASKAIALIPGLARLFPVVRTAVRGITTGATLSAASQTVDVAKGGKFDHEKLLEEAALWGSLDIVLHGAGRGVKALIPNTRPSKNLVKTEADKVIVNDRSVTRVPGSPKSSLLGPQLQKPPVFSGELDQMMKIKPINPLEAPNISKQAVISSLETGQGMHERWGTKELFLHPYREGADASVKATQEMFSQFKKNVTSRFKFGNKSASSERIGTYALSQQKGGKEILAEMGKTVPNLTKTELESYNWMRGQLEQFFADINLARMSVGKEPFQKVDNYFSWFRTMKGELDNSHTILSLPASKFAKGSETGFRFKNRRIIDDYSEVSLDAFNVFRKYAKSANDHIHLSPRLAKMRELLDGKFFRGGTPKLADDVGFGTSQATNSKLDISKSLGGLKAPKGTGRKTAPPKSATQLESVSPEIPIADKTKPTVKIGSTKSGEIPVVDKTKPTMKIGGLGPKVEGATAESARGASPSRLSSVGPKVPPPSEAGFSLREHNPVAYDQLNSWLNYASGIKPDIGRLGNATEKALRRLNQNLAFSVLSFNFRSAGIQPTALVNTFTELGPKWTAIGLAGLSPTNRKIAKRMSRVLTGRSFDVSADLLESGTTGKAGAALKATGKVGTLPLQYLDAETAKITWWGAYQKGKRALKLSDDFAAKYADEVTVGGQASGGAGEISPFQRTELGKTLSLFQTFVINNAGFLKRDVLGIGNKHISKAEIGRRVLRLMASSTVVNTLFEDVLDTRSPLPAPIHAYKDAIERGDSEEEATRKALFEFTDYTPFVGGPLRFGGSAGGPLFGVLDEGFSALQGKKSLKRGFEIGGKLGGVPGTVQIKKLWDLIEENSNSRTSRSKRRRRNRR